MSDADDSLPEDDVKPSDAVDETSPEADTIIGKIKNYLSKLYAVSKSLLGLSVLLVCYSVIGMLMFHIIEYQHELDQRQQVVDYRAAVAKKLYNIASANETKNESQWIELSKQILLEYEDAIRNTKYDTTEEPLWTMWGALFFCATIYTTIGYGHITPATNFGKVMTICFAVIGIPLALILLAEVGKRFTVGLKYLWKFVRRYYYTGYCIRVRQTSKTYVKSGMQRGKTVLKRASVKTFRLKKNSRTTSDESCNASVIDKDIERGDGVENTPNTTVIPEMRVQDETVVLPDVEVQQENTCTLAVPEIDDTESACADSITSKESFELTEYEIDENFNLPLPVASVIMVVYILLGSIMYCIVEGWNFVDAFYYVFISISTIGFGDFVPTHPEYFLISLTYLIVGLALVSMCINVGIDYLNDTIDRAKVKMDKAKDRMAVVGKQQMKRAGAHWDRAKDRAKTKVSEVKTKAREKATEVGNIAKEKATEVRKDIVHNVQKEVSRMKSTKKKNSVDSNGKPHNNDSVHRREKSAERSVTETNSPYMDKKSVNGSPRYLNTNSIVTQI